MPRYSQHQDFPPYSYVPGKSPHPVRDPRGHWFGREEAAAEKLTEADWTGNESFLFGIDLFNHGYYWEAHECWEAVWHACRRRGIAADFLKALIKLAAAGVKAREGRAAGVERHARRAKELLEIVQAELPAGQANFCGLAIASLMDAAADLAKRPDAVVNTSNAPVQVVLPFRLKME